MTVPKKLKMMFYWVKTLKLVFSGGGWQLCGGVYKGRNFPGSRRENE